MELEQKVIVTGVQLVSFTNNEGQQVEGCSVYYYDSQSKNDGNFVGCKSGKAWIDSSYFQMFKQIDKYPVEMVVSLQVDLTKGKLKPVSFKPVK